MKTKSQLNETYDLSKLVKFVKTDIWRIKSRTLSGRQWFWIRQLRILLLGIRGFDENQCTLRASALTFYTLLSIVPILAMAFGVAKGFGFEVTLQELLLDKLRGQKDVVEYAIQFSNSLLQNTQGGIIAGVGVIILFWTVIQVLGQIEGSFNEIWGVKKARSFARKFSDYLSIMMICPVLLIMSSSITVLIVSQVTLLVEKLSFLGPVGPVILLLFQILPFVVIWVLFTFLYVFMPNTKVNFQSACLGGIMAGTIYQIVQWTYFKFQVVVSNYGAVYGSFAALPLFLVWLQTSWLIVLFGAEISFAEQNVETYEFEPDCFKLSSAFKKTVTMNIVQLSVKNFIKAEKPWTSDEYAHHMEVPIRLVRQIIFELSEANILSEVKLNGTERVGYAPARDVEKLSIAEILMLLDHKGEDNVSLIETPQLKKIEASLQDFQKSNFRSSSNHLLKDL